MVQKYIGKHWIAGEFQSTGIERSAFNPANGDVIGTYPDGGVAEAELCVNAAHNAFHESAWKADAVCRSTALSKLATAFETRAKELAALISLENGKVSTESQYEVEMLIKTLRFQAGLAMQTYGRVLEGKPGSMSMVIREPIGVAGHIIPWNSPAVLLIRSLAPGLAAGTTAVVKMPSQSALVSTLMAEVISEIKEIPRGVVNFFIESGAQGAKFIVASSKVPAISFTGSTATGRVIAQNAASQFKRLGLELGGKGAHIIFNDADLAAALPKIVKSLTVFAGQFCMTAGRVLVHRDLVSTLRKELASRLQSVKVGPASDPSSEMGPLIDRKNVERVDAMVEEAISAGAEVLVRGGPVSNGALANGAFYMPTLLEIEDPKMRIAQDEVFGPVQFIQVFDTESEAISLANDSVYGLSASIWTRDVDRAIRVARLVDTGLVSINDWINFSVQFEIGGIKNSGLGRLGGLGSLDGFLEYKQIGQTYSTSQLNS